MPPCHSSIDPCVNLPKGADLRFLLVELSPSGGLFQFSYQLGTNLARQGHMVELVTGPDPELASRERQFTVSGILPTWHPGSVNLEAILLRRMRRGFRAIRHVAALVKLIRHVRRERPDVVMWHDIRFPVDAWALSLSRAVSPHVTFANVMHETRPLNEQRRGGSLYRSSPILIRSMSRTMRTLDVIFVLGENARRDMLERWEPSARVEVIPHGDEDVFLPDGDVPAVSATEQHVLFFGTWIRHKGIDVLLDSFAEVRSDIPDACLTIAGAVGGDVSYESVKARASEVGRVTLRPGYVPMAEVATLFGRARVVAVPYLRANQSGVVHLAQTFGRPVVATAVGDIPAAVGDGVTGLVIPPGDVAALTNGLRLLLLDSDLADRLGREGRRRVEAEASWDDIARKVSSALEHRV